MNKFFWAIPLILVLFGCGNPVDKIDAKKLKTACDCAQAAEILITERLDIQESNIGKDIKDIDTAKLMKRWNELIAKQDLVFKNCTGKKELLNCKDWSKMSKVLSDRTLEINKKSEAASIKKKAN
jgi:hypothetical protein